MDLRVLLDAPDQPARRVQIAKLGENFSHPKHGTFSITTDDVDSWRKGLDVLPGSRALIDQDHYADRTPRNTEAAGWITGVGLDGDKVMADIEWTDKGQGAIAAKRYLFFSPTYGKFTDETGKAHDNVLLGGALTNRPFLNMPTLTLASPERVSEAIDADPAIRFYARALDGHLGELGDALLTLDVSQAERDKAKSNNNSLPDGSYPINNVAQLKAAAFLAASKHGDYQAARKLIQRRAKELGVDITTLSGFGPKSSDSRRTMDKALLTALGLDEDTALVKTLEGIELDDDSAKKLLDAAGALKTKAEKPAEPVKPDVKTLESQAASEGLVLLDAETVTTMKRQAAAGETALKTLHEQRFEHAFETALTNADGPKVRPAEKDQLHHFFTLDADATIDLIEKREPILPAKPKGNPALELDDDADPAQVAAAGLHPEGHDLDKQVRKYLLDNKKPMSEYPRVLEQYASGDLVL